MAIDLGDSTFRPLLAMDMKQAWNLVRVDYDEPQSPNKADKLPRGFLRLGNLPPGTPRGIGVQTLLHPYQVIGQFAYPTGNTTAEQQKALRVKEFLDLVTAGGTRYHSSYRYRFQGVDFQTSRLADNPAERFYTVIINFGLEWETGT